ncbi:unnamed protein product [Euphydryas editha]|uniref:Lipase domain-containing protein n=1 Tax=Euphydryas editha TaxID=104508 RepID=A0AAU9U126_EUPED|nr:unnamed protein product [Euphydryas editha]
MKSLVVIFCMCTFSIARRDTGFPAGLMAHCPGMTKNTTLSDKTKDSLTAVVLWPSNNWIGSKEVTCKLNREGADCVEEHLDFAKKTVVFISGYLDASFSPVVRAVATPYLARGRNVIILEIYPILHRTYPIAARLTKPLGILFGEFLAELTRRGLHPDKLELLGGSLGAHIASYAATRYYELTHLKPSRLTGLDPAGPCFRTLPRLERFNSDAAHKVDAVHTNIDGFGLAEAVGHVDFYINGGEFQPSTFRDYLMPCFQFCSHVRSAVYWIISNHAKDKFIGVKCDSVPLVRHGQCYHGHLETNVLGPKTNFSRPGIYYIPTLDTLPYYMGEKGLIRRQYDVNNYLLKVAPDEDMII